MSIATIIASLELGLKIVNELTPLVKEIGGPDLSSVTAIGVSVASIAENTLTRIAEGKVVASARETQVIKTIMLDVQRQNDALAAAIEAS